MIYLVSDRSRSKALSSPPAVLRDYAGSALDQIDPIDQIYQIDQIDHDLEHLVIRLPF